MFHDPARFDPIGFFYSFYTQEEVVFNETNESYKHKHGYAVVASTILLALLFMVSVASNNNNGNTMKNINNDVPMLGEDWEFYPYSYPCTLKVTNLYTNNMQDDWGKVEITPNVLFNGRYIASREITGIGQSGAVVQLWHYLPEMQNIKVNSPTDWFEIHSKESDTFSNEWSHTERVTDICNTVRTGCFVSTAFSGGKTVCSRYKEIRTYWKHGYTEYTVRVE